MNLKRRVMSRIYLEYTKNVLFAYPDYVMFFLFMVATAAFVSIPNVIHNIPKDTVINTFNFLVAAFRKTEWVMQVLVAGFFVRVAFGVSAVIYRDIQKYKKLPVHGIRNLDANKSTL